MNSEKTKEVNILLISPTPKNVIGGISSWTRHILNYYNEHKNNVVLQQYFYSKFIGVKEGDSIFMRLKKSIPNYIHSYIDFVYLLKHHDYNVLHLCSSASLSLIKDIIFLHTAHRYGIKAVIHFHFGRIPDIYKDCKWEHKLLNKTIKLADKVIVIDKPSYDVLIKEGYNNICLLPNPLSSEVLHLSTDNPFIKRRSREILFVGHLYVEKGIFELIDVCKDLKNVKVKMFGEVTVEIRKELNRRGGENQTMWLEIVGNKDLETVIKAMQSCDVFVLPTYTEGFPNVILEAMACGCPIIASAVGAIPEMLNIKSDKPCGMCITPKDKNELKTAIEYMLDNPNKAKILGERAKERVTKEYSIENIWNKLITIWNSI